MKTFRELCSVALVSSAVLGAGKSQDVTPDIALLYSNTSDPLAMRGADGLLSTSGRAGLHRSLDGGRSWTRAMRGAVDPATGVEPFINGLCTSSSNPSVVYAEALGVLGGPDGLYRTEDFGATWRPGTLGPDHLAIDCAVSSFDPLVVYVQAYSFSLDAVTVIKSSDGGANWLRINIPNLQQGAFVRTSPVERDTLYVGDHGPPPVMYVSHDAGTTFSTVPGATVRSFYLFLHPTNPRVFLTAADEGLYRFEFKKGGPKAEPEVSLVLPGGFFFAYDPADPRIGYAAADRLYRTTDGGQTFAPTGGPTAAQIGFGITSVAIAPRTSEDRAASRRVYVGTTRGPHRSDDGANTFVPIHDGYHGASVNDLSIDALGRLDVGVQHTVAVFRAKFAAAPVAYSSFGVNLPGSDSVAIAPSPTKPGSMVVGLFFGGVFHTEDYGQTWAQSDVTDGGFFSNFTRMSFAPSDANRVYLVTPRFGHGLYRSTDAGSTFTKLTDVPLLGLAVHPTQPDVLYVGTYEDGGGLFKSTDGATLAPLGQPGNFPAIAIDSRRPETVYAGRAAGGVIRTNDGGATWAEASAGLPSGEAIGIVVDGRIGRVIAWLQGDGLYQSDDGGRTWVATNDGESKRRSSIFAGRGKMVLDPLIPGRVYLGNSGVVQVDTRLRDQ